MKDEKETAWLERVLSSFIPHPSSFSRNIAVPGGVYLGDRKLPGLFHLLLSPASA
jgi:hypothetical protein